MKTEKEMKNTIIFDTSETLDEISLDSVDDGTNSLEICTLGGSSGSMSVYKNDALVESYQLMQGVQRSFQISNSYTTPGNNLSLRFSLPNGEYEVTITFIGNANGNMLVKKLGKYSYSAHYFRADYQAALSMMSDKNIAESGFINFGGFLIQWGKATVNHTQTGIVMQRIDFEKNFSASPVVLANLITGTPSTKSVQVGAIQKDGFGAYVNSSTYTGNTGVLWIAIGVAE